MTSTRYIRWLALLLAPLLWFAQASLADTARATLRATPATLSLLVHGTATVALANVSGAVRVASSNAAVASATVAGSTVTVTGNAAGTARLTVSDSRSSVTVSVTVTLPPMSVSTSSLSLFARGNATFTLANVSGTARVTTSNAAVATAALAGSTVTVTGVAAGTARLTVSDSRASLTVNVTVTQPPMSASPTSLTLAANTTAVITLSNVSGSATATTSRSTVATVAVSGNRVTVSAKAVGTASITLRDSRTTLTVPVTVTQSSGGGGGTTTSSYTLLAWNDLGMHCMDADYSVFSILPPFNNLHAQLVDATNNKLVKTGVTLTYEAMADLAGSINSISSSKTNFWLYAQPLYGASLADDVGLTGHFAPSATPRALTFDTASGQFIADGIPITPIDDARRKNTYPMVKVVARDASGTQLAQARVVLPVSDEMSCVACHGSNSGYTAARPTVGWANEANPDRDYKLNILVLHDQKSLAVQTYKDALAAKGYNAAGLAATARGGKPILCAACHASNALPGTGITGIKPLTQSIHSQHAMVRDASTGQVLDSINNRSACYQCHPGSETKCLRGVMGNAVDANNVATMNCQSCHGTMANVGSATRTGWLDQPNCQACHHDGARETSAVSTTGILKRWTDTRFATTANAPAAGFSLYRFSSGHGGLQCEACHGSTHAEYPSSHANDNVLSNDVQGRSGTIGECTACHKKAVPFTANAGPHGMHTVGSAWVSGHESYAKGNQAACAACHGSDYRGGILSTAKVARSFSVEGRNVTIAAGQKVGCYDCHNGPSGN